jgi:hypothetical protein
MKASLKRLNKRKVQEVRTWHLRLITVSSGALLPAEKKNAQKKIMSVMYENKIRALLPISNVEHF